jgi:hypothetical protein
MPGNHAVGSARGVAVFLDQLAADVGVQLAIERFDLRPQPLDLGLKLFGSHVVLRAPERAGVGIAQLARALIAQLGQARIIAAHRLADGVPARPQGREFLWDRGSGPSAVRVRRCRGSGRDWRPGSTFRGHRRRRVGRPSGWFQRAARGLAARAEPMPSLSSSSLRRASGGSGRPSNLRAS